MKAFEILPLALVLTLSFGSTPAFAEKEIPQDLQGTSPATVVDDGFRGGSEISDSKGEGLPADVSASATGGVFTSTGAVGASGAISQSYLDELMDKKKLEAQGSEAQKLTEEQIREIMDKKKREQERLEELGMPGLSTLTSGAVAPFEEGDDVAKPLSDEAFPEEEPAIDLEAPTPNPHPEVFSPDSEGSLGEMAETLGAEEGILEGEALGARFEMDFDEASATLLEGDRRANAGGGNWVPTHSFNPR